MKQIYNLELQMNDLNDNFTELQDENATQRERIDVIESEMISLRDDISNLYLDITDLENRLQQEITDLEGRLE